MNDSSRMNLVVQSSRDRSIPDPAEDSKCNYTSNSWPQVLVVDDDTFNVEVIQGMLSNSGVASDSCLSGLEGIKLIKQRINQGQAEDGPPMYSLIMLDYSMPAMDGPQFATKVRCLLDLANVSIPFICCCTAYAEASFKR